MLILDQRKNSRFVTMTMALAAGSLLGIPSGSARADVAMTVIQAANTAQANPEPQTVKLYLKGSHARLEIPDGPVLLYDGKGE